MWRYGDIFNSGSLFSQGYVEDQSIHRDVGSFTENAMTLLGTIERPYPQLFSIYKGEFWTILHRSFCQYVTKSPDNVARSLAAYFTGFRVSDESYFQTVACHPEVSLSCHVWNWRRIFSRGSFSDFVCGDVDGRRVWDMNISPLCCLPTRATSPELFLLLVVGMHGS